MAEVVAPPAGDRRAAQQLAPSKRYWAIVGNGPNRIAAEELRIKLSELCYKAIACDATEDKKHIDLSSEPLILVCAAGLKGSTADDVAKEVAIYRAHKATPIVVCQRRRGPVRRRAAGHHGARRRTRSWRSCCRRWPATCSATRPPWPSTPRPARCARPAPRSRRSSATRRPPTATASSSALRPRPGRGDRAVHRRPAQRRLRRPPRGRRPRSGWPSLVPLRHRASLPLEAYQAESRPGRHADGASSTTSPRRSPQAIEELTRPVDAIKHQAKTVTVGHLPQRRGAARSRPWCRPSSPPGTARDRLGYRALRTLAALDPAVAEVTGLTRYGIDGDPEDGEVTVAIVDRGGICPRPPARAPTRPGVLRGTKHPVAHEREVTVTVGRSDGRTVVIVPEVKDNQATGITLLHVRFRDDLSVGRRPRGPAGLPQPLGRAARRGARDRADLPRRPARRPCPPPTCSSPPWPSWPTTGARRRSGDRRDRAVIG